MTHEELVQKSINLSGLPTRKTKDGSGALRWLSDKLNVNPSTVSRWGRKSPVPRWAIDEMAKLEKAHDFPRPVASRAKPGSDIDTATKMLGLATDPALQADIIKMLSAEDALQVAERIENPELRNALAKHSMLLGARFRTSRN
jgi:hypothetical protein